MGDPSDISLYININISHYQHFEACCSTHTSSNKPSYSQCLFIHCPGLQLLYTFPVHIQLPCNSLLLFNLQFSCDLLLLFSTVLILSIYPLIHPTHFQKPGGTMGYPSHGFCSIVLLQTTMVSSNLGHQLYHSQLLATEKGVFPVHGSGYTISFPHVLSSRTSNKCNSAHCNCQNPLYITCNCCLTPPLPSKDCPSEWFFSSAKDDGP